MFAERRKAVADDDEGLTSCRRCYWRLIARNAHAHGTAVVGDSYEAKVIVT